MTSRLPANVSLRAVVAFIACALRHVECLESDGPGITIRRDANGRLRVAAWLGTDRLA
jgi:hypothetical protein